MTAVVRIDGFRRCDQQGKLHVTGSGCLAAAAAAARDTVAKFPLEIVELVLIEAQTLCHFQLCTVRRVIAWLTYTE